MHEPHNHWCAFTADVLPWERSAFEPILEHLSRHVDLGLIESEGFGRRRLQGAKSVWLITHDWRSGARKARSFGSKTRVFISVLGLNPRSIPLPALPFQKLMPKIPNNVTLIAHSPLNHRFLLEMEQIPKEKVLALPVALPNLKNFERSADPKPFLNIATFAPFTSESNLHYFLTLAHYVLHRRPDVRFTVMGSGKLFYHVSRLASELNLIPRASILESFDAREVQDVDVFIYAPLRNDHFVPLKIAAASARAVVCTDVPGVADLVDHGKSGYVMNGDDIRGMGDLVLRYADNLALRQGMGQELKDRLSSRFSAAQVGKKYEQLFLGRTEQLSDRSAA